MQIISIRSRVGILICLGTLGVPYAIAEAGSILHERRAYEAAQSAEPEMVAPEAVESATQDAAAQDTLGQVMQKMKRQLRRLNRSLTADDGGKAASEDFRIVLGHLITAKDMIPELAAEQPEAERGEFTKRYRLMMIDTIKAWLDVEAAFLAGNKEETEKRLEAFKEFEAKGHKAFKK